jgi:hypothetical protein
LRKPSFATSQRRPFHAPIAKSSSHPWKASLHHSEAVIAPASEASLHQQRSRHRNRPSKGILAPQLAKAVTAPASRTHPCHQQRKKAVIAPTIGRRPFASCRPTFPSELKENPSSSSGN